MKEIAVEKSATTAELAQRPTGLQRLEHQGGAGPLSAQVEAMTSRVTTPW